MIDSKDGQMHIIIKEDYAANAKFCMARSVNTSRRRILKHTLWIYNKILILLSIKIPGHTGGC